MKKRKRWKARNSALTPTTSRTWGPLLASADENASSSHPFPKGARAEGLVRMFRETAFEAALPIEPTSLRKVFGSIQA